MSQIGQYISIHAVTPVESLTGNVGGPVFPDGAGNIDTIGAGNIFATGNPGAHSMTFTVVGTLQHSLLLGNAAGAINNLGVAANGQLPIGSVGADPVLANITAGPGIVVTNGPGSITLSTDGSVVVTTLHTQDGHNVTPTAGVININGAGGLATTGTIGPNTVTITAGGTIAQSFPTDAGTATPAAGVLNIIANQAGDACGSSVFFTAPGAANTVQLNVTDALSNTIVGNLAGNLTLTGTQNTGLGNNVLSALTTGSSNVGLGSSSLRANTTGSNNIAMGVSSLLSNVSGANNVALGIGALQNNVLYDNNTAVGATTLQNYVGGVGTSGFNVALGVNALNALQTRNSNTAIGALAGEFLVSGIACTLLGAATGSNLTASESYNVLIGASSTGLSLGVAGVNSLVAISTQNDNWFHNFGTSNIFVGKNAGNGTLTGTNSVGVGNLALNALTTGNFNTALGNSAGSVLLTGTDNTLIGNSAGSNYVGAESSNILIRNTGTAAESNTIRIGTQGAGAGQQNTCFIAGIAGVVVANTNMVTINTVTGQLGSQAIMPPSGVTWSVITVNQTAVVNNGYFCNKAGTLALALPAASVVGDVIEVSNENTALGIQFTQAAGQQILIGNTNTTLGATGTLTSSAVGDTLKIVCYVANTIWRVTSSMGNWTPA